MSSTQKMDDHLRERIISEPEVILEDQDVMSALVAANDRARGSNVVDLRGIAMTRLEARLDRLEETHRNVIAAAYENLAGTNQVHRAILRMLDPTEFDAFLHDLSGEVAAILRVDSVRLVLESEQEETDPSVRRLGEVLKMVAPGFVASYSSHGRNSDRPVTLRQLGGAAGSLHDGAAADIRSEVCLRLDLGEGRLPGMLVLGSKDAQQFTPQQGTDLLTFFAGVFERAMRRWLA
ncbi:MAG: DUF484 family protein [Rhodobacterales bacterium]|nr:DUF484 family protein [Rhodobacterales bacterium]